MIIDIAEIMKILPHRFPFLLVDRILDMDDESVVGLKNVSVNEPFFQGHFPSQPIMPGVLILEGMAQAGGIFAAKHYPQDDRTAVFLMGFDRTRFRRPVRPGDQLIFRLKLIRQRGPVFKMSGQAFVDDQLVAETEIMATVDSGATAK